MTKEEVRSVEIAEIERWGWECPKCMDWCETMDDPAYTEKYMCESCGQEVRQNG